jgi:tetratricopeptide (TPR) repeat protein
MSRIELPKRIAENIDQFIGRTWLLSQLLEWIEDHTDERVFLITGEPGTGKSMLLAWLAGFGPGPQEEIAAKQLSRIRAMVKAGHFCQAASRNVTPQAFAESIANQLTRTVPGFGEALAATLAERVQILGIARTDMACAGSSQTGVIIKQIDLGTLGDELSFDRAFTQPLKKFYGSSNREPMIVLVDALDEAETYTGVGLSDLLSQLTDLPAQVRLVATTRNEPRVLKRYRQSKPFDLLNEGSPDADDLKTYAAKRLEVAVGGPSRIEFAERLARSAQGIFLYATLVLDELLERLPSELPDFSTLHLPKGLRGLYYDFLNRELGKDERLWFELYEPLLGLLAVARGKGLNSKQLTNLTGQDIRAALRVSRQYLSGELPDGPFRIFHKSLADFLLEDDENIDYHIEAISMHRRIVNHYLRPDSISTPPDWEKVDDYGLLHLGNHLFDLRYEQPYRQNLYDLLCGPFMSEKLRRYGSHQSFASDLCLAIDVARSENPRNLVEEIRANFIYSQLGSMSTMVKPELLGALAAVGQVEKAKGHAALIQGAKDKSKAYCLIAEEMILQKRSAEARSLLAHALAAAENIKVSISYSDHLNALWDVLETMSLAEDCEGLERIAATVEGKYPLMQRTQVFGRLAATFARVGLPSKAEEMARQARASIVMIEEASLSTSLGDVAVSLGRAGDQGGVDLILSKVRSAPEHVGRDVMRAIIGSTVEIDRQNRALALADELFESALICNDDEERVWVLGDAARSFLHLGEKQKAGAAVESLLGIIVNITSPESRANHLNNQAEILHDLQDRSLIKLASKEAVKIAMDSTVADSMARTDAIEALTKLRTKEALRDVLENAAGLEDDEFARSKLASGLAKVGEWESALRVSDTLRSSVYKSSALSEVAKSLTYTGAYERAFNVVEGIEDSHQKIEVLSWMAVELTRRRVEKLAIEAVESVLLEVKRATKLWSIRRTGLGQIALALINAGRSEQATEVADRAYEEFAVIPDESISSTDLLPTVKALIQVGRLDQAFALAEKSYEAKLHAAVAEKLVSIGELELARQRAERVSSWVTPERETPKFPDLEVQTLVAASLALSAVGELSRAKELALRSFALARSLTETVTRPLKNVAQALAKAGEMETALDAAQQCLQAAKRTRPILAGWRVTLVEAAAMTNAVEALVSAGALQSASEAARDLLEKAEATADDSFIGAAARANAAVRNVEGLKRALKVASGLKEGESLRAGNMIVLTQSFSKAGNMTEALKCMLTAQESDHTTTAKFMWESIGSGAEAIAAVDKGETLWRIYEAIMSVDEWL